MNNPCLLIGDIGGTNARFALAAGAGLYRAEQSLRCADYAGVEDAILAYLGSAGVKRPEVICLAAAGPVVGEQVQLTNNPWLIDAAGLRQTFGAGQVRLLNDFEAISFALPHVACGHTQVIGDVAAPDLSRDNFTVCVLGPGTGLGAGGLRRYQGTHAPIVSEAGHVGFAPESPLQAEVWLTLQARMGRVSDELLLSGSGLPNLYSALAEIAGLSVARLPAEDIFRRDAAGETHATQTIDLFLEMLGQAAGNLVLSLGAFDGVFIAGGILPRYIERVTSSGFRRGFENKGVHRRLLEPVPSLLVTHPEPGLCGVSTIASRLYEQGHA